MKKRKTIEEREDDEEQKIRYLVNTDLIEGFIKDQAEEIQDISTMRDQAMAQLSHRDLKKPAMLPNQTMASIAELKKELQKAKGNSPLQLSILETLVMKAAGQEKIGFLHEKICIWLDLNRLQEAENDANALLALQTNSANRLLCSRILNRKKDFFGAMTQFLRCGVKSDDVAVSELYNSLIFQLQKSNFVHSLSCIGSNINYTLGDGTQDSSQKPKYPPELKGKIIVQACCGEFHTLVLASSCPHIARKEICNKDVFECCGGVDIIGWGENSHGQIMNYPTQEPVKKPLALDFLVGFKVKSISTSRYFSAASLRDNIKIWGDIETTLNIQAKSISCGVRFLLIAMENEVMVWGSPSYDTSSASSDLKKIGSISSVKIASGLAHGLVLDRSNSVYVFGFGEKGELGLGPSLTYSESLVKLDLSEISNILCHGQISVAISKNIVYVWGLVNPECLESSADIQWAPEGLILPSNVTCAGIGGHELLAMCEDLKIYIWEWKFSKRFKKMLESYQSVVNIRDICVGRSMHVLLQGVLIGQMTEIVQCPDTANSHEPFIMNIQLFDQFGPVSFKSPNVEIYFGQGKENTKKSLIEFAVSGDSELEITPFGFGKFCIHVLVNNCEAKNTKNIEILPSQADLQSKESLEEKQQKDLEKEREKQEKLRKAEEEQKKAAEALEESARKKKEETGKRAQEALKSHREKTEHDKEKEEKERKQRLEMKTGGGYDLKKKKK